MNTFVTSCLICAVLCVTPLVVFFTPKTDSLESERRKAAVFPVIPKKVRVPEIKHFFKDFDAFFADNFPFRNSLLVFYGKINEATGDNLDISKAYRGKNKWLFLGNNYARCVDQLQGHIVLSGKDLQNKKLAYLARHNSAKSKNAEFIIVIGPNKSSIYPENLPFFITPSTKRYISPLLAALHDAGVKSYDPTPRLLQHKDKGLLYYRTDTHWNGRGAYEAFMGFSEYVGLPPLPQPAFSGASLFKGDLISIGGYINFPVSEGDTAQPQWDTPPSPLSPKSVWVFGDSFTDALLPYIEASFTKTKRFRHQDFENVMAAGHEPPDMIIWVIVERGFAY